MVKIKERVALLLGIKEKGKKVDFDHIYDKINRDVKFLEKREVSRQEIIDSLNDLEREGYIKSYGNIFEPLPEIDEYLKSFIFEKEKFLNRSYVLVWKAKNYYPIAGRNMLNYLKERPVSVVKIFSGKNDPINEVDPIFVRYAKYKPYPQHIIINNLEKLIEYVHDHCIDFIPYVHKLNSKEPDIFVLDLDAGKLILEKHDGFEFLKYVTKELYYLLEENDIVPMIKFSGSRGFQIWASLDNKKIKATDIFGKYREIAINLQKILEKRLISKKDEIKNKFKELSELKSYTTSQVAHKEERMDKILIDWSSMKPQGDVRAPFSIHYKTGLVSLPLKIEELDKFNLEDAEPFKILNLIKEGKNFPKLELSDPSKILTFYS